jgi:hypothetical protein
MKLDPDSDGNRMVPELLHILKSHMLKCRVLVLLDHVDPGMTVKKVLSIYKK